MEKDIQALLDAVSDLRTKADVSAVFGPPVTLEGRTIIPVARVAYGFGVGDWHATEADTEADDADTLEPENGTGRGGGGGAIARPFAVIEVTPQKTRVEAIVDEQKLALAGWLLVGWSVFWLARTLIQIFGKRE
ncbi:MAG TPA: hypothetical protein ENN99_13175 [Chloroflexi bacterium]|nr:hypothetical protein [Chloroflexota bacterium]